MKQSYKAYHPIVNEAVKFADFVKNDSSEQKFVAHCEDDGKRIYLADVVKPKTSVTVLIGPEGDFSHEEIEMALKTYMPVTLGVSRLRTETAALVATTAMRRITFIQVSLNSTITAIAKVGIAPSSKALSVSALTQFCQIQVPTRQRLILP